MKTARRWLWRFGNVVVLPVKSMSSAQIITSSCPTTGRVGAQRGRRGSNSDRGLLVLAAAWGLQRRRGRERDCRRTVWLGRPPARAKREMRRIPNELMRRRSSCGCDRRATGLSTRRPRCSPNGRHGHHDRACLSTTTAPHWHVGTRGSTLPAEPLRAVTMDHSLLQELVDRGFLFPGEAARSTTATK